MALRPIAGVVLQLSVVALTSAARAQLPAVGPEFQANAYTTAAQYAPRVAAAPAGDFVVVWASYSQDAGYPGLFGRRYDAAGVGLGPEFQVDSSSMLLPSTLQSRFAVAASGVGFIVAWDVFALDGTQFGIVARRFDGSGIPQGPEFPVSTYTTNDQRRPSVAADAAGNFVVVWESYGQDTGPSASTVIGRRYDSAGAPEGGEFVVNSVYYDQRRPDVASDAAGNFVVVWHGYEGVAARLFDDAGVALGDEFVVDAIGGYPAVDADAAGFVVAWDGFTGVFGRRYDGAGIALGPAFQANTFAGLQRPPDVALGAGGDFAITWSSLFQDGSGYGVFGRRFDGDGTPRGDDFRVNTYTTGDQRSPTIAGGAGGRFVIGWESASQDGSDAGVFAQRYDPSVSTTTTTSVTSTTSTSSTTTSIPPLVETLFPIRRLAVKPGSRFRFVARATLPLPQPGDDPSVDGASMGFGGTMTGQVYLLQAGGWSGLGPGGDGSRGYRFRGTLCNVILRTTVLKATCRDDTGDFALPEPGDVNVILSIGAATRYCGDCGGTPAGNPGVIYKRLDCPAPASCF